MLFTITAGLWINPLILRVEVIILDKEDKYFERGVREAIWKRVEQSKLNRKDSLRNQVSHAWDEIIGKIPRRLSGDQSVAWWSREVPDAT